MRRISVMAALLLVSACGGNPQIEGDTVTSVDTANSAAQASGWNPLDACETLGRDDAAAATGSPVVAAEITNKVEGGAGMASFSSCTFTFANGAKLAVLTRESPVDDTTPAAIEQARTAGGTMPPATDVPDLGKTALWSDTLKGLQVFLDGKRYAAINYVGLPDGDTGKDMAIEVAKKLQ